jgi:hypothetical protein
MRTTEIPILEPIAQACQGRGSADAPATPQAQPNATPTTGPRLGPSFFNLNSLFDFESGTQLYTRIATRAPQPWMVAKPDTERFEDIFYSFISDSENYAWIMGNPSVIR